MSDYSKMGDGIGAIILLLFILCCIFVPLGVWKLAEIIIWIWSHIHWS